MKLERFGRAYSLKETDNSFLALILKRYIEIKAGRLNAPSPLRIKNVKIDRIKDSPDGRLSIFLAFDLPEINEKGFFQLNANKEYGLAYAKFSNENFANCLNIYFNPLEATDQELYTVAGLLEKVLEETNQN